MEVEVDEDAELAKALEASKQALVDDERKRWEQVLTDAAREREEAVTAQLAAVLEEPLEWWHVPMDVDLPPAPPLPEGLVGMRWVFTGGVYEVERAPHLPVEDQEQLPTPPAAVPPRGNGLPTHLYQEPEYFMLDSDEEK